MVLDAQALIGDAVQEKKRAHHVQHVLGLHNLMIEIHVRVSQVDREEGIVVAHGGAQ